MGVLTVDRLVEGWRRDDVFAWLADPAHHDALLRAAFPGVRPDGDRTWKFPLRTATGAIEVVYRFEGGDQSHGGRRVLVKLDGRRTRGEFHFSLRTMKPSTNTLVTAHADYTSGRVIGLLLDATSISAGLEGGMKVMLETMAQALGKGAT